MENFTVDIFEPHIDETVFYSFNLSKAFRNEIADSNEACDHRSALAYDHSFGEIHVFIEMIDTDFYWAYLKDYCFGHMKPLGQCIYTYEMPGNFERLTPLNENRVEADRDENFYDADRLLNGILPDLAHRIESGEIDIRRELHDYYHNIPDEPIPTVNRRMLELVSVKEASKLLEVTPSRIKKMVVDEILDGFKKDGKIYLSKQGVLDRRDYIKTHGKPTRGKSKKKEA